MDKQHIQELRQTTDLYSWMSETKKMTLADITVISPMVNEALDVLTYSHLQSKYYKNPQCGYILGDTGTGKSNVCKNYIAKYPPYEDIGDDIIKRIVPVLYAILPATISTKTLTTTLLLALGDPFFYQGTEVIQNARLQKLIENCEVELIILDEAQHIYDRDSQKIIYACTNWIKNLVVNTKKPVVLVGLPETISVININEQLKSRLENNKAILEPLNLDDSDKTRSLRKFLKVVDMKLPLPESSNLDDPVIVALIFEASSGIPRTIMEHIIIPAAVEAIDIGLSNIPRDFIKKEIARLQGVKDIKNGELLSLQINKKSRSKSGIKAAN